MVQYPFPSSNEDDKQKKESSSFKKPEFVFVEKGEQKSSFLSEEDMPKEEGVSEEPLLEDLRELKKIRYPFWMRIASFFLSIFCLFWAYGALLCVIGISLAHLLTFGYFSELKNQLFIYWNMFKKAMTYFIGCLISAFSPMLGISFLLVATLLRGDTFALETFLKRMNRP